MMDEPVGVLRMLAIVQEGNPQEERANG